MDEAGGQARSCDILSQQNKWKKSRCFTLTASKKCSYVTFLQQFFKAIDKLCVMRGYEHFKSGGTAVSSSGVIVVEHLTSELTTAGSNF